MAEVGTGAETEVINKVVSAPLLQQIDDVLHLVQNRGLLQTKVHRMEFLLRDIRNVFENQQGTLPASIQHCLDSTSNAIGEAKNLIYRSQMQQRCLDCIFCKPRISRQIREYSSIFHQNLQELQTLFSSFASAQQIASSSAQPPAKELLQPLPEWGTVGIDIKSAETRLKTWLTEAPQLRRIGVYGMAGVGKTTLLKLVYNFYKVSDVFDVVIWLTISQDYKISDLQGRIAKALNLNPDNDVDTLKMMLSASLIKKKFLLIFDDMWGALDFQELGVAFGSEKLGSKVVFSTRSRDLALMEAQQSIKVERLSRDEGWALFKKVAFRGGHVPEELKECAREIADECEGLPLAITVVAAAMSGKTSIEEWNTSLSLMKIADPSFPSTHPRVDKELYRKLRWSYDDPPTYLQNCFLYCALFPEDHQIWVEGLAHMWIAEGVVKSKEATHSMDMDLGRSYVKILIDRGLFQNANFEKQSNDIIVNKPVNVWKRRYITVHDVIRDMAIYIGEKEDNYLCRAGQGLKDFPLSPSRDCKTMSLDKNEIEHLPNDLVCTQLSVPTSLGQLRPLEYLSLRSSQIKELPEEICNLSKLQFFNLAGCGGLSSLPCMIGNHTQLPWLHLWDCPNLVLRVEISQLTSLKTLYLDIRAKTDVMALKGLTNLSRLSLGIYLEFEPHEMMGTWLETRHLWLDYRDDSINNLPSWMQNIKKLQSLRVQSMSGLNLPNWICEFQQLQRLELTECHKVEELTPLERLPNLKYLKLHRCNGMRHLGIGSGGNPVGFPVLERLDLILLQNLQSMGRLLSAEGGLKEGSLPELLILKIQRCRELKKLPMGIEKLLNLKASYGDKDWWDDIMWEENNMKGYLQKLYIEI